MNNKKFWVSDLSEKTLEKVKKQVEKVLQEEGIYTEEEIKEIINDLPTNKLADIEHVVGKEFK